ncbi:MAG: cobalt-precorrin-5B (C(1))-methyltransferase CbiD [Methanofastidiosum sp.]|jgi:cobalt-precorrin-5B (C1)-methyltransferase|nr:cobalt-precorrin-5B (C(1))-methyltransferase CbiD [Bacteroidales bacterium]
MEKYIVKDGKKLRYGYTTGTCAAAASKAAALMLFNKKEINQVSIVTPKGWELFLDVHNITIEKDSVSCCVIKDAGDDPDVTNKLEICTRVEKAENGITITGGKGVGIVTKKGLSIPVGSYAINPVPLKMIRESVSEILPNDCGIKIEIFVPKGEEVSKKTFNPDLGIVGGISIIGTSGIVEPMSEEALKEAIMLEISILKEEGEKNIIFVPGNYGINFLKKELNLDKIPSVKISNFVGDMLDKACEFGIGKILLVGHIGKLVKVASGSFNTHSKVTDSRMETLAANCALIKCDTRLIREIMESNTTEEAVDYILKDGLKDVFNILAEKISERCTKRTQNKIEVSCVIYSLKHGLLGMSKNAENMIEGFKGI